MIILTITMNATGQYESKVKVRDLPRGPITSKRRAPKRAAAQVVAPSASEG